MPVFSVKCGSLMVNVTQMTPCLNAVDCCLLLQGERGDPGGRGLPGKMGLQGEEGEPGVNGTKGQKGTDGVPGSTGVIT